MRWLRTILIGLSVLAIVAGGGLVAAFVGLRHYSEGLPDFRALADYQPKVVTRIHAGDGQLLAEFSTEKRVFVPIASIPKLVKNAFISAEDKNFYRHNGVDPEGILRAAVTDLKNFHSDKRPVGASTITQQVARYFLLTNEVSIDRKIKEMILAYRIEQVLSKNQILELYLNGIYLGSGSYGVAEAALDYFDKPLDELTVAEAAFLAAVPKNPNKYYLEKNRDAATDRRNYVIGRMLEDGVITQAQAQQALAEPLVLQDAKDAELVPAGHFTEEVRRELLAAYGKDGLYGGGLSVRTTLDPKLQAIAVKSLRDGLVAYDQRHGWRGPVAHLQNLSGWAAQLQKVPSPEGAESWRLAAVLDVDANAAKVGFADGTTAPLSAADMRWVGRPKASDIVHQGDVVLLQSIETPAAKPSASKNDDKHKAAYTVSPPPDPVQTPYHYELRQIPEVNGALVALDPHTGRVLALVGGMSYESSEFDRATQALRQPGSTFKPFVYLAALDSGLTPSTIVLDAPIEVDQGPGLPLWRPVNFEHEFLGPLPLRVALEKSLDAATVRVGQAIGIPKVVEYAKKFGIADNLPPYIATVIGAGETTLMRLTTAYAEIDNGGKKIVPTLIDRIQDRNGKTLFSHDTRPCAGCAAAAFDPADPVPAIPDIRPQIQDPRTAYQMVQMLEGVVQRGTARSLASLGYTLAGKTGTTNDAKDLWFIGFSPDLVVGTYIGFDEPKTLGRSEQGASVAVPVVKEFMGMALVGQPQIPFRTPPGLRTVRVDFVTGELATSRDPASIWEAYLPGTEPGVDHPPPPNAELLTAGGKNGTQSLPSAKTGTGGIY